ncbi:DNA cytosine methyltransferase [Aliarcobacter butzleri]|uniref:DNA cytosine methyltransferase n=1 Tax=Aliarcobacter TaxID=2321111 RepID=UPI00100B304F|nr:MULTISPECIES: DNA cytosine methyltransferase [Aliarcobacter]MDN5077978.1 DNA cytosine methyltransferase [Aliarcobacter butzleri]MDN5119367.1 DNA cytosine methyltransferase [Aliarcobacter butzleri]RXJ78417.1 DNA (cytosine-5-)-methyltransferase [Aliarcobacter skirrowii]
MEVEKSLYYWNDKPKIDIKKNNSNNDYNVVDLFCGAGGITCGLHMTKKFRTILANDIFIPALETYKLNNKTVSTILGDVRKITEDMYKEVIKNNKIHLVTAGVPCQGFSLSNKKRHINDERNFLFLEVIKFVNIFNPDIVLIENVSGMKSLNKGSFVDDISKALSSAGAEGYIVKNELLNAADYGVPQLRKRLIFVAVKKGLSEFKFPLPEFGINKQKYRTIEDAISDLPELGNNMEKINYEKNPSSEYQKILRGNEYILKNHKSPNHPLDTIKKIKVTKPGEPMYENYKQRIRLKWDIQSPTQVAGGIRPQFQFGHPEQNRGLTIRERARIQSFPDNYEFMGGIVQSRVQTGNAVPPFLAKAIGLELIKVLDKKYKG